MKNLLIFIAICSKNKCYLWSY